MRHRGIPIVVFVGVCLLAGGALFGAGQSGAPSERTVEILYRFTVKDIPADAGPITAWIPIPPSDDHQRLEGFTVEGDWPYTILDEPEYHNRFMRFDLSGTRQKDSAEIIVAVTFRVGRKAYRVTDKPGGVSPPPGLTRYLAPDSLVPTGGKIAAEAHRVAGSLGDPLARARGLYDHIIESIVYEKTGKGWGRGDAIYACDIRTGNCTDFHSLFIGEARALGIPARFVMGLPLPEGVREGTIPGYHCWAEFYILDRGWVPLDASEAHKNPEKKEALFAGLDEHRVQFSVGRDISLPGASSGPRNYVIYPFVEIGGEPYDRVETSFSFRENGVGGN